MPKTTLQLSDEQAQRLRAVAAREHRSMHGQMLTYIEQGLARDDPKAGEESSDD